MPGRNGTGPQGMGPYTGRGLGLCNPTGAVPRDGYRYGMGLARRRGRGRGYGMGAPVQDYDGMTRKDQMLAYKSALENRLSSIDKQLEDM